MGDRRATLPMSDQVLTGDDAREKRIGLLAGWGRFPLVVARSLREQGYELYGLGIKDHADPELRSLCHSYAEIGVAKMGAQIRPLAELAWSYARKAGA